MAKKSSKPITPEQKLHQRFDEVLDVLQNLFILEAVKTGVPVAAIRDILRIDKKRIGAISKHVGGE